MKMTKYFVGAMAAMALIACSKEEAGSNGDNGVVEGLPAAVSFRFQQAAAPGTYATETGTIEEGTMKTAQILIFNNSNVLEHIETIDQVSADGKSSEFQITSGRKSIFVAVNFKVEEKFKTAEGTSVNPVVGTLTYSELLKAYANLDATVLAEATSTTNGFWMTNIGEFDKNEDDGTFSGNVVERVTVQPNQSSVQNFNVSIGRIVSKVRVNTDNAVLNAPNTDSDSFSKDDIVFQTANNPKKTYLLERYVTNDKAVLTPYYTEAHDANNYFRAAESEYSKEDKYMPENSHSQVLRGAIPAIVVRLQWAPEMVYNAQGMQDDSYTPGTTFYALQRKQDNSNLSSYIFSAQPTSDAFTQLGLTESEYNVIEYTDGQVYYPVFIEDQEITSPLPAKYMAVRNYLYNVAINNINGLGSNRDNITDPTQPIVSTANITVTITVSPWTVKNINTDLQ